MVLRLAQSLGFDVKHLAAAVQPIGWIYAVRSKQCAVLWVLCQLWQLISNCTTAFTAALLRLFAFWLSHEICLLK
jgi:hypothetical protein